MTTIKDSGKRMKICETCEFYKKSFCQKCGCFMPAKVKISQARCPQGKW